MNKIFSIILLGILLISNNTIAQKQCKMPDINSSDMLHNYLSVSFDTKHMVYAKRIKGDSQYAFYERIFENDTWGAEKEITSINSTLKLTQKIGGTCFNYNATVLYYSHDASDGNGMDIYSVKKTDGEWENPVKVSNIINTTANESDPSISPDGNTFFFVRDVKKENDYTDDFNCKTIFIAEKSTAGNWRKPYRMSRKINAGCEMSPRISADNRTLFFASVRNDADLGFDIYSTKMVAKGIWSTPSRIDTVCNEYSNIYPNISFNGDKIFYINQIEYGKKKEVGLVYNSILPKKFSPEKKLILEGNVTDLYSDEAVNAQIKIINPFTSSLISTYSTNKMGRYWFMLSSNQIYRIKFSAPSYSYDIKSYKVGKLKENKVETRNVQLYKNISIIFNVFDAEIFEPLEAQFEIIDSETNESVDVSTSKLVQGRYKMKLPIGKVYNIFTFKKNYATDTLIFDLKKVIQFDEFENDIELKSNKIEVDLNITNKGIALNQPVEVLVTNLETMKMTRSMVMPDKDGRFKINLKKGEKYNINISPKGYSFYNTDVDLTKKKQKKEKKIEVKLQKLEKETKLTLKNIIFETNSAELTIASYAELDRLVTLIKKNPKLQIEISAHSDNVGSDTYNLKLSNRRAQSVVEYLTDKDVPKDNLIAKGYGETKPIAPNDTDENKAKNRRVEMEILDIKK